MVEISSDSVARVFSSEMNEEVIDLEFIEKGIEVSVYIEGSGGEYVMKIHESEVYESPGGFLAGADVMSRVREAIEVPEVFVVRDGDESPFGVPFYIMEFVSGGAFEFDVSEFGSKVHRRLIWECGRSLGLLHSVDCGFDRFGWLGVQDGELDFFEEFSSMDGFMEYMLLDDFGGRIREDPAAEFDDRVDQIERVSRAVCDEVSLEDDSVFCYWDMKYENMIVDDEGGVDALLDWENPIVGSPLFNVVKAERNLLLRFSRHEGVSEWDTDYLRGVFRKGYMSESPYKFDFASESVRERVLLYEWYTVLEGIVNFDRWFDEDRGEAAQYYLGQLDEYEEMFC